jgi:hypothetical protein
MGGRSEAEQDWADRIASGLRRALAVGGVLKPSDNSPVHKSIPVSASTVLRPARGGIFIPEVRTSAVGTIVPQNTVLGYLLDPVTQHIVETFTAPLQKTAILLLRPTIAQLEGGAMTYVVAEPNET